jgi:hypothetical protein
MPVRQAVKAFTRPALIRTVAMTVVMMALMTQCAPDPEPGADFGHADPCPYTRPVNDAGDEADLAAGRACFDATVAEGTPVTWDLEVFTVEGDPVYYRVEWDGEGYTVHYDARADTFGGGTGTSACATLAAGAFPSCP